MRGGTGTLKGSGTMQAFGPLWLLPGSPVGYTNGQVLLRSR